MSALLFLLANLLGLLGYLFPFLVPAGAEGAAISPLLFFALLGAAVLILLLDLSQRMLDARTIALMGILAAANALLRLLDNSFIVLPGGFSPIFLLIAFCGYLFGMRFGFLFGMLSLLVSALVTGGVGPWLPYQMLAAAWMGGGAALLPGASGRQGDGRGREGGRGHCPRLPILFLAFYGLLWGYLYGFLLNLYYWPYLAGVGGEAGGSLLQRYLAYYLATSLAWDSARAVGNVALTLLLGKPLLRLLGRFRLRAEVRWEDDGVPPCGERASSTA